MADQKEFQRNGRKAFLLLYKHLVRSHLEYCNSVWAPYKKSYIDKLEKVHKRATKMISEFKKNALSWQTKTVESVHSDLQDE